MARVDVQTLRSGSPSVDRWGREVVEAIRNLSGAGETGPAGPTGATGATGPAGATGATGPAGPQISRVTAYDANHLYAYSLADAGVPTTLTNEGSGGSADLTIAYASPPSADWPAFATFGAQGPVGDCCRFHHIAGSGGSIGGAGSASHSTSVVTLEAFIAPEPSAYAGVIIAKWGSFWLEHGTGGNVIFSVWVGGVRYTVNSSGSTAMTSRRWHHVMGVYDGARMYIYIDGEMAISAVRTGAISTTANLIQIARSLYSGSYSTAMGRIARCAISDIARPQSYARDVYNRMSGWAAS